MDLLTITKLVFRRWYIAMPVLAVALTAAVLVQANIPPAFEARGSVLLEEAQFDPSRQATTVVAPDLVIGELEASGLIDEAAEDDVVLVPQARDATTIEFTAVGVSADDTEEAIEEAVAAARRQVDRTQEAEEVPPRDRIAATVLTPVIRAEELSDGTYQAFGTVLLRDPNAGSENPYTASGGTTSVLQAVVDSDAGRARVRELAPGVEFTLATTRDAAHIIEITTTGADPAEVMAAFGAVRDVLNEELDERQERANVATSRRIVVTDLAIPQSVVDVSPPLNRSVAAILGLGGLLAVAAAVAVESILTRGGRPAAVRDVDTYWAADEDPPVVPVRPPSGSPEHAPSAATGSGDTR